MAPATQPPAGLCGRPAWRWAAAEARATPPCPPLTHARTQGATAEHHADLPAPVGGGPGGGFRAGHRHGHPLIQPLHVPRGCQGGWGRAVLCLLPTHPGRVVAALRTPLPRASARTAHPLFLGAPRRLGSHLERPACFSCATEAHVQPLPPGTTFRVAAQPPGWPGQQGVGRGGGRAATFRVVTQPLPAQVLTSAQVLS